MRYCFFNTNLSAGGAERQLAHLIHHPTSSADNLTVTLLERKGDWLEDLPNEATISALSDGRPTGNLGAKLWWLFNIYPKVRRFFLSNEFDVVLTFLWLPTLLLAMIYRSRRVRPKLVWSVQTDIEKSLRDRLGARVARWLLIKFAGDRVDLFISPSQGIKMQVDRLFPGKPSIVIPNAVAGDTNSGIRERDARNPDRAVIITIGRLHAVKNQGLLLDAVADISRRGLKLQLLIVGEGPERTALEKQAKHLGIDEHVQFLGYCQNPSMLLAQADIFVSTSNWETFGIAIGEAMASGLPVIATATDGARDLIIDGTNGILIDVKDRTALISALERLIAAPKLRTEMGFAAKEFTSRLKPGCVAAEYFEAISA